MKFNLLNNTNIDKIFQKLNTTGELNNIKTELKQYIIKHFTTDVTNHENKLISDFVSILKKIDDISSTEKVQEIFAQKITNIEDLGKKLYSLKQPLIIQQRKIEKIEKSNDMSQQSHIENLKLKEMLMSIIMKLLEYFISDIERNKNSESKELHDEKFKSIIEKSKNTLSNSGTQTALDDENKLELKEPDINHKIFPHDPKPDDVVQSALGDCYLMSTLISLAKNDPDSIKECFESVEENNIKLRFFEVLPGKSANGTERYIPGKKIVISLETKKVLIDSAKGPGIRNKALWPKLIEKAYHAFKQKDSNTDLPSIEGGHAYESMVAITGKPSKTYKSTNFAKIQKLLDPRPGYSYVVSCSNGVNIKDVLLNKEIRILPRHAYAVYSVNKEKSYITLVEPNRSTKTDENTKLPYGGTKGFIHISFDKFKEINFTINQQKNK